MKQTKNTRSYSIADSKMVVKAGVVASLYAEDQEAFAGYSTILFHPEYLTIFQNKIDKVYNELSDKEIKRNLALLTQNVEDCIEEICVAHAGIMIFADIALGNDDVTMRQMGKGEMTSIKESHNSFQFNMSRVALIFNREKEKLEAAGCTADRLVEFSNLCKKMVEVHEAQENYKITRHGLTTQRITLLNEIYTTLVRLHEVAVVIWAGDKEYAKRYDLPQASSNASDEDIFAEEIEAEIEEMTHVLPISNK